MLPLLEEMTASVESLHRFVLGGERPAVAVALGEANRSLHEAIVAFGADS